MKHLCCSKFIFLAVFFVNSLFASLHDKSAIFYYGKNISYPMVGIHDYIVVKAKNTNTYSHGFNVYKNKIYAKVNVNKYIESEYTLTSELEIDIEEKIEQGFVNFLFDADKILDDQKELALFIEKFHKNHPTFKLMLHSDLKFMNSISPFVDVLLVEEYLKKDIKEIESLGLDIIDIEFEFEENLKKNSEKIIKKIKNKKMIPYITNKTFDIYGKSSKNAIKREIFTLINESKIDRMVQSPHQHGALPLEYMGYIQTLYDINKGLPDTNKMDRYAGVLIWLDINYSDSSKFIKWIKSLINRNIKVVFMGNFGVNIDKFLLKQLNIEIIDSDHTITSRKRIITQDEMIGFESEPSLNENSLYLVPKKAKPLYTYEDTHHLKSVPSAITQWGGYVMYESLMVEFNEENLWVIDPFKFFKEAFRLKTLLVPDTTTENGNRFLFTHIDGDGIMNYVESNPKLVSGDIILKEILKKYKIPHSVSVIGAEIDPAGLFPKLSERLINVAKEMYKLDNVEAVTHTFTHPFKWDKIVNNHLKKKYRLKVKHYDFSLEREITQSLDEINKDLVPPNRPKAKTVFWTGNCMPQINALELVYKNRFLNINGGDTFITNANPWLSNIAPIGLERGDYYQIYTGAQNENIYTHDWLGPFWGFKKVVQTFKLTNSPRRFKPIDIYYHLYSGSKIASLNALKYVFDWAIKQDVIPIYTSTYILKAMDYFTVSLANNKNSWLIDGMQNLRTVRLEEEKGSINFKKSTTALGLKHFENHTYISLDNNFKHFIKIDTKKSYQNKTYLISSNAKIEEYNYDRKNKKMVFKGEVDLKLYFHISKDCKIDSFPKEDRRVQDKRDLYLEYKNRKKVSIDVSCR